MYVSSKKREVVECTFQRSVHSTLHAFTARLTVHLNARCASHGFAQNTACPIEYRPSRYELRAERSISAVLRSPATGRDRGSVTREPTKVHLNDASIGALRCAWPQHARAACTAAASTAVAIARIPPPRDGLPPRGQLLLLVLFPICVPWVVAAGRLLVGRLPPPPPGAHALERELKEERVEHAASLVGMDE